MKIIFILILFYLTTSISIANIIEIALPENTLKSYTKFLNGRDPLKVKKSNGPSTARSVIEVVLLQQALFLGGSKAKVEFIVSPTYSRMLNLLNHGKIPLAANTVWAHDIGSKNEYKDIYISHTMINDGEFEAGLYVLPSNKRAMSSKNLEDVQKLIAISNKNWIPDWTTLTQLNLKGLHHTVNWKFMIRMINVYRGDFTLAPFQSTPDLSFTSQGIKFVPIPNLKVGLRGTRHFAISKKHPKAKEILTAINSGIKQLREKQIIKKAYIESGFFNPKVKNWKKLN